MPKTFGIRGVFAIKHFRNGKCLKAFETKNAITKRGAIHMFHTMCGMPGVPYTLGGTLNDFLGILGVNPFFIISGGSLSRDDAIEYRDNGGTLVQGDNRAWTSGVSAANGEAFSTNPSAGARLTWVPAPVKNDTSAVAFHQMTVPSTMTVIGAWLYYARDAGAAFACRSVNASVLFPSAINAKTDDIIQTTYTLSFNSTPAIP